MVFCVSIQMLPAKSPSTLIGRNTVMTRTQFLTKVSKLVWKGRQKSIQDITGRCLIMGHIENVSRPNRWNLKFQKLEFFSKICYFLWLSQIFFLLLNFRILVCMRSSILEWVAVPSPRGSSQPRNRTQVSSIAGRFITI